MNGISRCIIHRLADGIGIDGNIALGVDQIGAKRAECGTPGLPRVGAARPQPKPNVKPALWQASAALSWVS